MGIQGIHTEFWRENTLKNAHLEDREESEGKMCLREVDCDDGCDPGSFQWRALVSAALNLTSVTMELVTLLLTVNSRSQKKFLIKVTLWN